MIHTKTSLVIFNKFECITAPGSLSSRLYEAYQFAIIDTPSSLPTQFNNNNNKHPYSMRRNFHHKKSHFFYCSHSLSLPPISMSVLNINWRKSDFRVRNQFNIIGKFVRKWKLNPRQTFEAKEKKGGRWGRVKVASVKIHKLNNERTFTLCAII